MNDIKYHLFQKSSENEFILDEAPKPSVFIKQFKTEQRISVEIFMRPNIPDLHGHWMSEETIQKGFDSHVKAIKEGRHKMNLFHLKDDDGTNIELLNQYIIPCDCIIGNQEISKGTWIQEIKWHNETLWKKRTEVKELPDGTVGTEIAGLSPRFWGVINEPIEKANISSVKKDDKGNLIYRGQKFVGYNKPMKSNREGKQGMVLAKKDDQIKLIHFGDPSLPDNQSREQYNRFVDRFIGQDGWDDKFSALYWSRKWLWPSDQIGEGTKEFYKLKD